MKKTISLTTPLTLTNLHKSGEVWVDRVVKLKKSFDSAVGGRKERIGKVWLEMFWRSTTLATLYAHQTHQLPATVSKNERVVELLEGEESVFEKSQQLRLLTTLTPKPFKKGGVVSKSKGEEPILGHLQKVDGAKTNIRAAWEWPEVTPTPKDFRRGDEDETKFKETYGLHRFTPPTPPTNPPTSKDVERGDKE